MRNFGGITDKLTLLGGIPRSGTSLACTLFNQLEDALALIEPMDMAHFCQAVDAPARRDFIHAFAAQIRGQALRGQPVSQMHIAGEASNTFSAILNAEGKRETSITGERRRSVNKPLSRNFHLLIKHPNAFVALLPELQADFRVFIQVRNPLAVLSSWSSLSHPLSQGHAPMAERFNPLLAKTLATCTDDLLRQVLLVNWYFECCLSYLEADQVLFYEQLVASGGKNLVVVDTAAARLDMVLTPRNRNTIYNKDYQKRAVEQLLRTGGAWRHFYKDVDLCELLGE